jgi:hypothetical protein
MFSLKSGLYEVFPDALVRLCSQDVQILAELANIINHRMKLSSIIVPEQ